MLALAPATAAAGGRVTPGSRYVALGDSVTFGYVHPSYAGQALPAEALEKAITLIALRPSRPA